MEDTTKCTICGAEGGECGHIKPTGLAGALLRDAHYLARQGCARDGHIWGDHGDGTVRCTGCAVVRGLEPKPLVPSIVSTQFVHTDLSSTVHFPQSCMTCVRHTPGGGCPHVVALGFAFSGHREIFGDQAQALFTELMQRCALCQERPIAAP